MDWNWFFSSLAQSTAAIVGIFGAFIITKTLSNQSTFDSKRNHLRELASKSQNLVDEANDLSIDWYNGKIAEWRIKVIGEALEKRADATPDDFYEELNFSIYQSEEESKRVIEGAIELHKRRKAAKAAAARERSALGSFFPDPREMALPDLTSHFEIDSVKAERTRIDSAMRNAKQHIRVVRDALSSVAGNPEHSPQITYTLLLVLALFYLGVIYPLSFTPVRIDSSITLSLSSFIDILFSVKGFLLFLVSAIFTIVVGMFFVMNIRMRYSDSEIEQLNRSSQLGFYSAHFEIAEANRASDVES